MPRNRHCERYYNKYRSHPMPTGPTCKLSSKFLVRQAMVGETVVGFTEVKKEYGKRREAKSRRHGPSHIVSTVYDGDNDRKNHGDCSQWRIIAKQSWS